MQSQQWATRAGRSLVPDDDNDCCRGGDDLYTENDSGNGGSNSMTTYNDDEEAPPPLPTTSPPSLFAPDLKGPKPTVPAPTAAMGSRRRFNLASFPTRSGPEAGPPSSPVSDLYSSSSGSSSSSSSDFALVETEETYTSSLFQTEPLYQFYDQDHVSHNWV